VRGAVSCGDQKLMVRTLRSDSREIFRGEQVVVKNLVREGSYRALGH